MICKRHPKYKAIRKPTADCKACRKMWKKSGHNPATAGKVHKTAE